MLSRLVFLAIFLAVSPLCGAADSPAASDRGALIAELASRLKAQQRKLPDHLFVTGTGAYLHKHGRDADAAVVKTTEMPTVAARASTPDMQSRDYHIGIFTEGSMMASYEGRIRDLRGGFRGVAEVFNIDMYKPSPTEGWMRNAYVTVDDPTTKVKYSHSDAAKLPLGYFSVGVGPIRAQGSLADTGQYKMIVNNEERYLKAYDIVGFQEAETRIMQLSTQNNVGGYFQESRFRFDDSRGGILVAQDYRLHDPISGHIRHKFELRAEYAPAPPLLAEHGIAFVLTRHTTTSTGSKSPDQPLEHIQSEEVRCRHLRVTTTPPTPPEWYTEFEAEIRSSSDGQEEAAANARKNE